MSHRGRGRGGGNIRGGRGGDGQSSHSRGRGRGGGHNSHSSGGRGRGRGGRGGGHVFQGGQSRGGYNASSHNSRGRGGYVSNKMARKAGRREAQLQAMNKKADQEDQAYYATVDRQRAYAAKHGGYLHRRQKKHERELFSKQGGEGINFDQYDEVKVERSGSGVENLPKLANFQQLGGRLPKFLARNIQLMKYARPTPIQSHALPIGLKGRDLMCCAQTGSGKTCAFLLPIVVKLAEMFLQKGQAKRKWVDYFVGDAAAPFACVLAPTRELAIQIEEEAEKLCNQSGLYNAVVYGGSPASAQLNYLASGVDILVATPGRLQDFISRDLITMERLIYLVLDEADRMLDMGFEPQIRKIIETSGMPRPGHRQTLMFSATFPAKMQSLAGEFMADYVWIGVGRVGSTVSSITQQIWLASADKTSKLTLLSKALKERPGGRTLVFVKKKSSARWVSRRVRFEGINADEIHGDRSQSQREAALARFRSGAVQVLVATDVAARGLDVADVVHVINFDLGCTPDDFESYVHRIGRTGRAGNKGLATSFYVPGFDAKQGSGRIAGDLYKLLRESNQEIPDWFMKLSEVRNAGRYNGQHNGQGKFGGRDVRRAHNNAKFDSEFEQFQAAQRTQHQERIAQQQRQQQQYDFGFNTQGEPNVSQSSTYQPQHQQNQPKQQLQQQAYTQQSTYYPSQQQQYQGQQQQFSQSQYQPQAHQSQLNLYQGQPKSTPISASSYSSQSFSTQPQQQQQNLGKPQQPRSMPVIVYPYALTNPGPQSSAPQVQPTPQVQPSSSADPFAAYAVGQDSSTPSTTSKNPEKGKHVPKLCRDFKAGNCKYGAKCRFSHSK